MTNKKKHLVKNKETKTQQSEVGQLLEVSPSSDTVVVLGKKLLMLSFSGTGRQAEFVYCD
jgi:hypothetical protein